MTWYAFFDSTSGALASLASQLPASVPTGVSYVSVGASRPDPALVDWDAATKAFINRPPHQPTLTRLEFSNLFTDTELAGILAAQASSATVQVFLKKLDLAQDIDLTNVTTQAGVNALATAGLITTTRAGEILAYVKPTP